MASRRRSMEEPPNILSDVIHLEAELNKIYKKTSAECQTHIEKMSKLTKEFEEDYERAFKLRKRGAIAAGTGGALMIAGLVYFTAGAALIAAGLGGATAIAGGVTAGVGQFRKSQQEKNIKQSIATELEELQNKMRPMINLLEKMFQSIEEILRDPTKIPKHNLTAIRDRFYHCFQKCTNLTGNLSETSAKIGEMLKLLDEILEDNKDEPEKPIEEEELKKKKEELKKKKEELKKKEEELKKKKEELKKKEEEFKKKEEEFKKKKEELKKKEEEFKKKEEKEEFKKKEEEFKKKEEDFKKKKEEFIKEEYEFMKEEYEFMKEEYEFIKEEYEFKKKREEYEFKKRKEEYEFKEKAETFIDEMKKGTDQLKNTMNKISRMKEKIAESLNY